MRRSTIAAALALGAVGLVAAFALRGGRAVAEASEQVTYARDIAPLVHASCAPCHRPGGAGPFDLLDYDDVARRARQIVEVTRARFMPPWLPDTPGVDYVGQRRLSDAQIELLERWYALGTPEGDPDDAPAPPRFPPGWQLGEPDLVLELPDPFPLPAEGVDVIRNFVLAPAVQRPRWVRVLEIRPSDPRVVHHAILKRDRTRRSRLADERDPGPGFGGMAMGGSDYPEGQILVWTPGTLPRRDAGDIAWRLEPGDDLVLQLHMVPGGKPESVQARLGLHFTDEPPRRTPHTVVLRNDRVDIPAGARRYVVEDALTLPVAVTVLGLYPHAHYLARTMEIWATAPGGQRSWLLRIPSWDFNWQGMYHLREPMLLRGGTTLHLRYTYDNSEGNLANPNHPPRRVRAGNRSADEMATLAVQVLLADEREADALAIAQWEDLARDDPSNPSSHYNLGVLRAKAGDWERAARHYARALAIDPGDAATHHQLAATYYRLGREDRALQQYARAVELDPWLVDAQVVLGYLLTRRGEPDLAVRHLQRALELEPDQARVHLFLGQAHERRGDTGSARASYRRALELEPGLDEARRAAERLAQGPGALPVP
jgi:Flp pilus assembly protein TadD